MKHLGGEDGLVVLVVLIPAWVCTTDPKLNASHQGVG